MATTALRSSGASGARRYAAGQPLTVRTAGGWRDADVAAVGADGLCHSLTFLEGSGEPPATLTLHPWNHAPRELPQVAFEALRAWWTRELRARQGGIADALTGHRLDALQQCVAISVTGGAGVAGGAVLSHLRGEQGQVIIGDDVIAFHVFSTVGALELLTTSGVAYFEAVILEVSSRGCCPQLGFATPAFVTGDDAPRYEGVGDDAHSWGLDGIRKLKWSARKDSPWACTWKVGDTIGLAANVDLGKIAVSKNGSWTGEEKGVVFTDAAIKQGVYPALTASMFKLRCAFSEFNYAPPPGDVWHAGGAGATAAGTEAAAISDALQQCVAISVTGGAGVAGGAVLSHLRGEQGQVTIELGGIVTFSSFSTVGALELLTTSGVAYFEAVILEVSSRGCYPQLGFATPAFVTGDDARPEEGVGDDAHSWGLDGIRKLKWSARKGSPWSCTWKVGDTIGLAANVDLGKIAVSKNGSWTGEENGVVFTDAAIKQGVYPALTASKFKLRCALSEFKYAPPLGDVWQSAGGAGGATAAGTEAAAISDAHGLLGWLLAQHSAQLEGRTAEAPRAALLTAGPASGKT
eukprot:jgi/Chrpa1/22904/Chrysochromulina_OHIO_Genome00027903-RA